jgi:hypothetical protein
MPGITLDLGDAAELAEMLTFLAEWLSGSQKQTLADSFAAFLGHPACDTGTLCSDLHRFAFLLGETDGEELFGEPHRRPTPEGDAPSVTTANIVTRPPTSPGPAPSTPAATSPDAAGSTATVPFTSRYAAPGNPAGTARQPAGSPSTAGSGDNRCPTP